MLYPIDFTGFSHCLYIIFLSAYGIIKVMPTNISLTDEKIFLLFILQKIFSIPTDALLILFLRLCRELRDFCGFSKVPTLLSFPGSNSLLSLILNSCFKKWWITLNLSVSRLIPHWLRCLPLIPPTLNFMLSKIIPRLLTLLLRGLKLPTCPNDSSLAMKYCGVAKKRADRPHQMDISKDALPQRLDM